LTALEICSTPESSFRLASSLNNNCFAMILFLLFYYRLRKPQELPPDAKDRHNVNMNYTPTSVRYVYKIPNCYANGNTKKVLFME
jgi:hypothetical protein